jgi:hypothetical protein
MFSRQDFRVGQKVYFGRERGEQTLGKIIKLNPTRAKIEILERRGNGRGSAPGSKWVVHYESLRPADTDAKPGAVPPPVKREPLTYNPFNGNENLILEALVGVYSGLSPENLACDGEASAAHIRRTSAELNRQLRGLTLALGREVDEGEVYGWYGSKTAYDIEKAKRKTA